MRRRSSGCAPPMRAATAPFLPNICRTTAFPPASPSMSWTCRIRPPRMSSTAWGYCKSSDSASEPSPNPLLRKEGEQFNAPSPCEGEGRGGVAPLSHSVGEGAGGEGWGRLALGTDLLKLLERLLEGRRVYHYIAREGQIEFPDTEQHQQDQDAQHGRLQQMQLPALHAEQRAEADGDKPAHDQQQPENIRQFASRLMQPLLTIIVQRLTLRQELILQGLFVD